LHEQKKKNSARGEKNLWPNAEIRERKWWVKGQGPLARTTLLGRILQREGTWGVSLLLKGKKSEERLDEAR